MDEPLVSVIIPVYNAARYVELAVRSIMEQTYRNLEILICDDCSTDASLEIIRGLAQEDSRIVVERNEENLKIVPTLNKLVDKAQGKYIARMDADDISHPQRIEKQVQFMNSHPLCLFCGTNAHYIDESGKKIGRSHLPTALEDICFFLKFYSAFCHPSVLFRASVIKTHLYSDDFLFAEDYELWCRLLIKEKGLAGNLQDELISYRIFKSQSSQKHFKEQALSCSKIALTYGLVEKALVKLHGNIFYFFESKKDVAAFIYIAQVCQSLEDKGFFVSLAIYRRVIVYILRYFGFPTTVFYCLKNRRLAFSFLYLVLQKLQGRQ